MTVLAVVGMKDEARIVARAGVNVVVGGGDAKLLRERLESTLTAETKGIISIGIGGGLVPSLRTGDVVVGTRVIFRGEHFEADEAWAAKLLATVSGSMPGVIAGSNLVARNAEEKASVYRMARSEFATSESRKSQWHEVTGAFVIDMESHIAARVALERGLPLAVLRTISDIADGTLPPVALVAINKDGGINIGAVVRSLLTAPWQIPTLVRLSRDSAKAFAALLGCVEALGPGLGCPYLG